MSPDNESVPSFKKFDKVGSVPITRRSPPERQKDLDDILSGKDDSDDPTGEFEKIDQMVPVRQERSLRIAPVTLKVHLIGCTTAKWHPMKITSQVSRSLTLLGLFRLPVEVRQGVNPLRDQRRRNKNGATIKMTYIQCHLRRHLRLCWQEQAAASGEATP